MKRHLRMWMMAVLAMVSANVFAADDVTVGDLVFNVDDKGYAYVKAYNGTATAVEIPATVTVDGKKTNVRGIGDGVFEGNTTLEKVSIVGNLLNYVGDRAFKGCTALKYMNWAESSSLGDSQKADKFFLTFLYSVGESAFEGCTSITDISMYWVTDMSIGANAFRGCTSLASFKVYATDIADNAFADCPALTSVLLYQVTSVSKTAFSLPSGGNLRVFYPSLTDEIVESLRVQNASALKAYLYFGEGSYVKVISSKVGFSLNNSNLTVKYVKAATETEDGVNVELEDTPTKVLPANTALIVQYTGTSTSPGFTLSIPETPPTASYTNLLKAATDYTTLPASTDAVRYYLFEYKDRETLDNFVKVTYNTSFAAGTGYLEFGDASNPYPDFDFGLYTNGNVYVKKYKGTDEVVTIPETVVYEGDVREVTGFGPGAFEGNTTVKKILLSRNGSFTMGERAFKDCTALTTIVYTDGSGASSSYNETYDGVVFFTSNIQKSAFEGCTAITNAKIRYTNTKFQENAMKGCTALTTIGTITGRLTLSSAVLVGPSAFENCTSIQTVTGTSLQEIGEAAFRNSGLTTMFIGSGTFYLTMIELPSTVYKIGAHAFEGTPAANVFLRDGILPEMGEQTFGAADEKNILLPIEKMSEEEYDALSASYDHIGARLVFEAGEYLKVISSKLLASLNTSNLVVKRISAVEETADGVKVTVEDVAKRIYAGTALIVQYVGTSESKVGYNLNVAKSTEKPDYTNYLLPATEDTSLPASDGTTNYYRFATTTPGDKTEGADYTTFEKITAKFFIPEGSAYLKVSGGNAEVGTTGIREVKVDNPNADVYYDLNGVRVDHPKKGIYIRNGKKVVVK